MLLFPLRSRACTYLFHFCRPTFSWLSPCCTSAPPWRTKSTNIGLLRPECERSLPQKTMSNHILGPIFNTRRRPMKILRMLWTIVGAMFLASMPVFAQPAAGTPSGYDPARWKIALAAIGMGIASGLCGLGQGKAVASAAEAIARNPGAVAAIRGMLILGLGLIESPAIYTLVIVFVAGPISLVLLIANTMTN